MKRKTRGEHMLEDMIQTIREKQEDLGLKKRI
jgi:hypothetical protein